MMISKIVFYFMVIAILGYAQVVKAACESQKHKFGMAEDHFSQWKNNRNLYMHPEKWSDTKYFDIAEYHFNEMKKNLYQATITKCVDEWNFIATKVHNGQQYDTDYNFKERILHMSRTCDNNFNEYRVCTQSLLDGGYCTNNPCKF